MKPWQVLFRMAPKRDYESQGDSTGFDDFADEAADEAAAREGEEEIEELDEDGDPEEEPEEESEDDQSDEDQDDEEEEEGEEEEGEEQEEEAAPEDRFKDPKSGDFDFKRINKVLGGDFLEKRIKEADATITRTFQELKSYKDQGTPEKVVEFKTKAGFLDNLVDTNPIVQQEVLKALGVVPQGGAGGGRAPASGANGLPPGVNPEDPLLPLLLEMQQGFQTINNRHMMEERARQQQEQQAKFSQGLESGKARFKELVGKIPSPEQAAMIEQKMKETGYINASDLVPALFWKEIQDATAAKLVAKRVQKKNLPKTGSTRRPVPTQKKKRYREDDRDELWEKHMGQGIDD